MTLSKQAVLKKKIAAQVKVTQVVMVTMSETGDKDIDTLVNAVATIARVMKTVPSKHRNAVVDLAAEAIKDNGGNWYASEDTSDDNE